MPSSTLRFRKYQGLGNDFLVADLRQTRPEPDPESESATGFELARKLCDRRFGVGGDGVLTITAPRNEGSDATMRVLNADGSEAEMCGNGLRCVAKYLLELDESKKPNAVTVDTGAGALLCQAHWSTNEVVEVTVDMGRPHLERGEIPVSGPAGELFQDEPLVVGEHELRLWGVGMGNPHAITFVGETGSDLRALAEELGPTLEVHELFPNRSNIEFARIVNSDEIELVVWERGCGITLACGTGACATVVAACLAGHCQPGSPVRVHLLGGDLVITVDANYERVHMQGPTKLVYEGQVDLAKL